MDDQPRSINSKPNNAASTKLLASIAVVIIIAVAGFMAGAGYQKAHDKSNSSNTASNNGFGGGRGGFAGRRLNGGRGSVTAVSASSITINDDRTSSSKTYTINSSTTITDNGATVDWTDIKTGDTVFVTTSSSTSTDATRILVNPTQGGFGPGSGQSTNTPSSGTTDSPSSST